MRLKLSALLVALACVPWCPPNARAATNIFVPMSGYAFHAATQADNAGLFYSVGRIMSSGHGSHTVVASLGHAAGGANGFTVWGRLGTTGELVTCSIHVTRQSDGFQLAPYTAVSSGSQSAEHRYTLFVRATPPNGAYFYSMVCVLPSLSDIGGVRPDA